MQTSKIWDGAVRFFHWSQVLLLVGLWVSAEQEWFALHMTLAYGLASLLLSRLVWGFWGSENARFRHFIHSPKSVWRWWKSSPKPISQGHTPLSGYMVITLLLLLCVQFGTGLMTSDQILTDGPLVSQVPSTWVTIATTIHHWNINLILTLVAVHIAAALWHQWRGDKIITAMITGQKVMPNPPRLQWRSALWYFALVLIIGVGFYLWQGQALWPQLVAE